MTGKLQFRSPVIVAGSTNTAVEAEMTPRGFRIYGLAVFLLALVFCFGLLLVPPK